MSPVGFETIVKYLYDDHLGTDLSTAWPKISALCVFRNPKLLELEEEGKAKIV
jgi:hypothetical protein